MNKTLIVFLMLACLAAVNAPTLQAKGKVAAFSQVDIGNGKQGSYQKLAPSFRAESLTWPWPLLSSVTRRAQVSVDFSQVTGQLSKYHFGQNTSWWAGRGWSLDEDRRQKAMQAGLAFWRFPGGSSADEYFWDGNYGEYAKNPKGASASHMNEPWAQDTAAFLAWLRFTGSEPIITLNYGLARYGTPAKALDLAKRWVREIRAKGIHLRYVELGNEVQGNWETGNELPGKPKLDGELYAKDFNFIAKGLKKEFPDLYVGAVAVPDDDANDWSGYRWWMRDLLPKIKDSADYLIYHEYFLWPYDAEQRFINPSYEKLLANLDRWTVAKAKFDAMAVKYMGGKQLPIAITEFNLINASPPQTLQAINMIFTAASLGELTRLGYAAANFWDWKNGFDEKLNGDHGMLAQGELGVADNTPRPTYYAYAVWQRASGDALAKSESDLAALRVYASSFSGGEGGLILVNSSEQDIKVSFDFKGKQPGKMGGYAQAWVAQADQLASKTVHFNGQAGPLGGGGPFPLDGIKPYLLKLSQGSELVLPKVSVVGLVLY